MKFSKSKEYRVKGMAKCAGRTYKFIDQDTDTVIMRDVGSDKLHVFNTGEDWEQVPTSLKTRTDKFYQSLETVTDRNTIFKLKVALGNCKLELAPMEGTD